MEVALKICVLVTDQKFPLFMNITHFLASGHEISPSEYDKQGRTEVLCTGEWGSGGAGRSPCLAWSRAVLPPGRDRALELAASVLY